MVNYDYLKELGFERFVEMVNRGIISVHLMDYLTIYDTYLHEKINHKKSVAITYCSDEYNCSENTIRNIINFMER